MGISWNPYWIKVMGMIAELDAQRLQICCFCEKKVRRLTKLELSNYKRTALCPNCFRDSVMKQPKNRERTPVQVPLPLVGSMPAILKLPPITFGQIVLYRSDLLIDCIIKVEEQGGNGYCTFTVIAPGVESSDAIAKYIGGKSA